MGPNMQWMKSAYIWDSSRGTGFGLYSRIPVVNNRAHGRKGYKNDNMDAKKDVRTFYLASSESILLQVILINLSV